MNKIVIIVVTTCASTARSQSCSPHFSRISATSACKASISSRTQGATARFAHGEPFAAPFAAALAATGPPAAALAGAGVTAARRPIASAVALRLL